MEGDTSLLEQAWLEYQRSIEDSRIAIESTDRFKNYPDDRAQRT